MTQLGFWIALIAAAMLCGCSRTPWNDPYPASDRAANILYSAFQERPKHLDPAVSYSSNEVILTGQIYEPPLQYDYLARPYRLEPLTAERVPRPHYLDRQGRPLPSDAPDAQVAYSVYYIHIKPGIYYQPHPAFARDAAGHFLYQHLTPAELAPIHRLSDFPKTGTKELTAADYVYEIKRLASPTLDSPILGLMSQHIVGLAQYAKRLAAAYAHGHHAFLDLRRYPLAGAKTINRYTYRIELYGKYPQFKYWLAMPFFAPVPWEVDHFYAQPGMASRNLTLDWFPVGTGPYMLTVNDPNRRMVLVRNPNFHRETYPTRGAPGDAKAGLLKDAGRRLPFIDKVVFSLEKEQIPYWNKFLQGYYDASGIGPDNFDQAIRVGANGSAGLTSAMRKRGIRLQKSIQTSIMYMGFNMLDPVVGGYSQRARDLRQAISIAINYEAYIAIFLNGRGIPAQGPIPPGIFGYVPGSAGIDPYVYDWVDGRAQRKPIAEARRLLAEAGYPDGRDEKTGKPLLLYLDTVATGPSDAARLDWLRAEFRKLDIQLVVRSTDYNRFQDKMRKGHDQIFEWGWNADYPDPENFLFLLYGPNREVGKNGENAANYENPEYDRLFEAMRDMDDTPARQAIIERMVRIAQKDAPWIWGFYPVQYTLYHSWYHNAKVNLMANNTLKYLRIDPVARERARDRWNRPKIWPLGVLAGVFVAGILPVVVGYRRRERRVARPPEREGRP